jgi:dTDP-4-dehydrorhamnose reductase
MKVLVTGATGQVGRALLRSAPPQAQLIACAHAQLDVGDEGAVATVIERYAPNLIINAAAYTAVDRAESEPDLALRINAEGPRFLAMAARRIGARLVHISTDFVFDGTSAVPYLPQSGTNPLNAYGRTKLAGEQAVLEAMPERSIVLRTAWVYAAEGRNFVNTMLRVMRASGAARVVCDQVGTPTSAQSVAEAIWCLADNPQVTGVHHWTDAGVASWYDFAVAIAEEAVAKGLLSCEVAVSPIATSEYPTPARRPAYSVLDKGSLMSLGMTPIHWRKCLRAVLGEMQHA